MADSSKREKIAAARKKLKQFQSKTGRTPSNSPANPKSKKSKKEEVKENTVNANCDNKSTHNNLIIPLEQSSPTLKPKADDSIIESPIKGDNLHSDVLESSEHTNSNGNSLMSEPEYREDQSLDLQHISRFGETSGLGRPTASTESLQQLSRQLNGLLQESSAFMNSSEDQETSSLTELETRNRELASLLEKHAQANEQLNSQVQQLRSHSQNLQDQLLQERHGFEDRLRKDLGSLKEQLQVHIQTIGILVAEKTELQSQLNQSTKVSEQRFEEIEELTGRLKASRQRVADLERNLSTTSSSSSQNEKTVKELSKEVDNLKLSLYKSNKSQEEFKQKTSELNEKLQSKVSECSALEKNVLELKKKLEMVEIYTNQLNNQTENKSQESLQIVEQLQHERDELTKKVSQYNEAFQKVTAERDQISDQYQQFINELQKQSKQLTQQVKSLTEEREEMLTKQHDMERKVQQLQRQLEDYEASPPPVPSEVPNTDLEQELEKARSEYDDLMQRHEAQIRDNAQLSRLLAEMEEHMSGLQQRVENLGEEAGDKAQLLENVQSDKTALSRAITQNKELKFQLAELQNGFVKMSNDNMDMMTRLESEIHTGKELAARLGHQEDELKELREVLSEKERELKHLQNVTHQSQKESYQQEQLADRLRHYEAQAQLVETLQRELQSSQDMVNALTTQNSELRTMLIKATETKSKGGDNTDEESSRKDDVIDSLSAAIHQLELERNQLMEQLKEHRNLSDNLSVKVSDMEQDINRLSQPVDTENGHVNNVDYDNLQKAMQLIEMKYTAAMRDKADLSDKADQLEHLVTQLQGETDTIGEYISLYHHQRALLQQREQQKNAYIIQLSHDREDLQAKLGQLQALVMQMLGERNMLHSYNIETDKHQQLFNHPHHHHHHHGNHEATPVDPAIQPHLSGQQPLKNGKMDTEEWPDYSSSSDSGSEVEAIVAGRDDLSTVSASGSLENNHSPQPVSETPAIPNQNMNTQSATTQKDPTAKRILDLLTEIGHNNLVEKSSQVERNFHPCKYCTGRLMTV
ncbi:golgin subfamily A member 2-like [Liolophura sinensis]|uniref:golgin subfamily A member 2-like n=1 Tax=Liolophura sinensis TaxID=3198878 RepID=UPI003158BBA3